MKKLYALTAVFAALSMSAFAQTSIVNEQEPADAAQLNEKSYLPSSVIFKAEGDPKAPIGYKKPTGCFYVGLSENYYGYNAAAHLMVPPFAEITFSAVHGDTVNRLWTYVNPDGDYDIFAPKLTSTEKDLKLTYNYKKPTQAEIPSLKGTGEHNSDSTFMTSSWMQIAKPYLSTATAGRYGMGNHPTGRVLWFNTKYYNSSTFTFNSNSGDIPFQERWLNQYKSWYGDGVTAVNVKGLGEKFDKPAAPITLTGILINGRTTTEIGCDFKVTVRDANCNILAYFIKKKENIQPTSSGGSVYMLKFDDMYDASGNSIEELILDEAFYVFLELQDNTTQFSVYYYRAPYINGNITMQTLCDMTYNGTDLTNQALPAGGVFTDQTCNQTFTIYLLAQYEYLHGDITEYEAPKTGGSTTVNVVASKEYLTYMERQPNWTVTLEDGSALPSWITFSATDSFDDEYIYQGTTEAKFTVAAQPTDGAAREATVKMTYHGASHLVKISQEGATTGINDFNADTDDNAPAYNLAGQRVGKDATGVIIKNGKKIIKK